MINMILMIVSLLVFGIYVNYIWGKYGIQKSISVSRYCLPDSKKWVFTLVLFGFTLPVVFVTSDYTLMTIAVWLISGVGAACSIISPTDDKQAIRKAKITKVVHMISAIGGITLGAFSLWFEYNLWWIVAIMIILIIFVLLLIDKGKIWWIELIAFAVLWSGIFINLF